MSVSHPDGASMTKGKPGRKCMTSATEQPEADPSARERKVAAVKEVEHANTTAVLRAAPAAGIHQCEESQRYR